MFNPTEEHKILRQSVRSFVEEEVDPQALVHNRDERFNKKLYLKCAELGLLGITIPEKFGGSGMDATALCIVAEEFSSSDPGFTLSAFGHALLFAHNLSVNGSETQKVKYLPSAVRGEFIGGMAMSEAIAGTDVLGMATKAELSNDGSHYILNGSKMWITNGTVDGETTGDVFIVYAKTGRGRSPTDLSAFIVEKGFEGFSLGQKIENKCGMRASSTGELLFQDVKVPADNLLGTVGGASLCMMRNLEIERLELAAMSCGIARRSIEAMNTYAKERYAFGKSIGEFGQISKAISESYADYMAGRSLLYNIARTLDLSTYGNGMETDGVKLYCAAMGKKVADRAIQVLGGNGYISQYQVERLWRDAKLIEIGGGTNEAHHKNIYREFKKVGKLP